MLPSQGREGGPIPLSRSMKLSKGFIYTFIAAFSWAVSIVLARFVLKSGEPALNMAFWTTFLAIPYWFFIFSKNFKEFKHLKKNDYLILLLIGIISCGAVSIVEMFALKYSPAVNYSFLIRTVILFTIIFAFFFLGEKITKKKVILASLILLGAYFLTTQGKKITLSYGDIFTLIEAMLLAFSNNVLSKMAANRMSSNLSASATSLIGLVPIFFISFFNNAIAVPKTPLLIIFITVFYMLITVFRFKAFKVASASYVTMIFSFTPVLVSIMAVPFLGESLLPIQILGGFFIVLAGVLVEKLKI
jgi:bacterial/archaeal transporter family protein